MIRPEQTDSMDLFTVIPVEIKGSRLRGKGSHPDCSECRDDCSDGSGES